jgi:hypothetical protein
MQPRQARTEFFAELRQQLSREGARRIACYGAGNDFRQALSEGLLADRQIVALLDDGFPIDSEVAGHRVRSFEDLCDIRPELLIATSSAHAPTLRRRATQRLASLEISIPVI